MSKFPKILLLLFFVLVLQAPAIQFISTNTYARAKGETMADEQWVYATDAVVDGVAKDDLFLLVGNHAALGGEFGHNVWSMGNSIDLTGQAKHNVRLMGRIVQIKGCIGGNLLALGDTLKISPDSTIDGSMKLMGNNVILEGTTHGDVSITAARSVTISGTIGGNLDIVAPEIILQRDTRIGGNLTYTAPKELVPAKGVVVGTLTRALPRPAPVFSKAQLLSRAMWFLAALLVGIPFISLFPMATAMATQVVRTSPWKCLWVGALCTLLLPVLGIVCISSGTGLPLGMLLLGGWAAMAYISRIVVALVVGMLVLRNHNPSMGRILLSMATGLVIIYVASAIPAISSSVWIAVISIGTGALLLGQIQMRRMLIPTPGNTQPLEETENQNMSHKQEDS